MDEPTQRYATALILVLMGSLSGCAAYRACGFRGCADDATITARIRASFAQHPGFESNVIAVQTLDHVVYLYGPVDTDLQRQLAESVALDTPGAARVVNTIAVNNRG
jgi:osmotically-inducible protein OsmY